MVFMEDMTDVELAQATKFPVGLMNLGECPSCPCLDALITEIGMLTQTVQEILAT
jgi:hypothetical protein